MPSGKPTKQGIPHAPKKAATANPAVHLGLVALSLELLFAGVVIMLAGTSDETGKMINIFLFGLWLVFLTAHPEVITRFTATVKNIQASVP